MPTGVYTRTEEHIQKCIKNLRPHMVGEGGWKIKDTSKMKHNRYPYWTVGITPSEETRKKISEALSGENNYQWQGENVNYRNLHRWVVKHRGKACQCEKCGLMDTVGKKVHWSNISRDYHRDLQDYQALCAKCHAKYDGRNKKCKHTN